MGSVPKSTPSTLIVTEVTPTLSVAEAVILTVPETVAPFVGAVRETVGGVVSGVREFWILTPLVITVLLSDMSLTYNHKE